MLKNTDCFKCVQCWIDSSDDKSLCCLKCKGYQTRQQGFRAEPLGDVLDVNRQYVHKQDSKVSRCGKILVGNVDQLQEPFLWNNEQLSIIKNPILQVVAKYQL